MGDIKDWFSTYMIPSSLCAHLSVEDGKLEPHFPDLLQLRFRVSVWPFRCTFGESGKQKGGKDMLLGCCSFLSKQIQEVLGSSTVALVEVPACRGQFYGIKRQD